MRQTSVRHLFEFFQESLGLMHVCGSLDRAIEVTGERIWPADLVGHLNIIHASRLQVIGQIEFAWARIQPADKIAYLLEEVVRNQPPAIVVADDCEIPPLLIAQCAKHDIALLTTKAPCASVVDQLRLYLSRELAEQSTLHGVFMDVFGLGVFITGDPGSGKSELALELISRGHALVADDMVEFSRIAPTEIEGRCPPMLQDFLEVRGLGVLNIRTVFGETACRRKKRLRLVVYLQKRLPGEPEPPRITFEQQTQDILGVIIPRTTLPVVAGRNLSVLLEAAVRTMILRLRGIDSMQELIDRQQQMMIGDNDTLPLF